MQQNPKEYNPALLEIRIECLQPQTIAAGINYNINQPRIQRPIPPISNTWARAADDIQTLFSVKDGHKLELVIKNVGPIWGQHEAEEKVNAFKANNGMSDWMWTGGWNSESGTSYAEFERVIG